MTNFKPVLSFKSCSLVTPSVSVDGGTVACISEDNTKVALYDKDGICRYLSGHQSRITCMAFLSEPALLLTGSHDGTIKVWDIEECECKDTLEFPKSVLRLAVNPKYQMVAAELDSGHVKLRHLNDKKTDVIDIQIQDSSQVTCLVQSDDQLIYGTDVGTIYVWNYEEENCPVLMLKGHKHSMKHLSVCDTNLLSIAVSESHMRLWDLKSGQQIRKINLKKCQPNLGLLLEEKGRIVIASTSHLMVIGCKSETVIKNIDVKTDIATMRLNKDKLYVTTHEGLLLNIAVSEILHADSNGCPDRNGNSLCETKSISSSEVQPDQKRKGSSACVII